MSFGDGSWLCGEHTVLYSVNSHVCVWVASFIFFLRCIKLQNFDDVAVADFAMLPNVFIVIHADIENAI